jgi:hypothetical protein
MRSDKEDSVAVIGLARALMCNVTWFCQIPAAGASNKFGEADEGVGRGTEVPPH